MEEERTAIRLTAQTVLAEVADVERALFGAFGATVPEVTSDTDDIKIYFIVGLFAGAAAVGMVYTLWG